MFSQMTFYYPICKKFHSTDTVEIKMAVSSEPTFGSHSCWLLN